jgi:hypothetical protein
LASPVLKRQKPARPATAAVGRFNSRRQLAARALPCTRS